MTSYYLMAVDAKTLFNLKKLRPYTNNHALDNCLSSLLVTALVWTGSIVVI